MADSQPTLFGPEIWKPVVGYEGAYEVSDHGRVRSLDRYVRTVNGQRLTRGKVMKSRVRFGYHRVSLSSSSQKQGVFVHVLVLEAFVGPRPEGMETCHNNGDKDDNRLVNLRWDTKSSNTRDQMLHGTHKETRKTRCPRGHEIAGPNLVPADLKRGKRSCLACCRANSYTYFRPELRPHFNKIADQYHQKIMSSSTLPRPA